MMNHEDYVEQKRSELIDIAKSMLSGDFDLIQGVRLICRLRIDIDDPDNPLFLPLRGIESEIEHFPIESMRLNCQPDYLHSLDAEMQKFVLLAGSDILKACQSIVDYPWSSKG